jgi:hypothetical protein
VRYSGQVKSGVGKLMVSEAVLPVAEDDEYDKDEEALDYPESVHRPHTYTSSIMVGCGVFLDVFLMFGLGMSTLISETLKDGNYMRLALMATIPITIPLSIFFFIVVITDIFQAIGPTGYLKMNSRFYSAKKPNLQRAIAKGFTPPTITIQMPVYKEKLEEVILPTVTSLKAAISYYESRGGKHFSLSLIPPYLTLPGTARIFINDDGMAYRTDEEAQERKDFYIDNNIGWVSRPRHGDDFVRAGKFKKASNMNFALNLSNKLEDILQKKVDDYLANKNTEYITAVEESRFYQEALNQVLEENPRAQCEGNIRVGEIILIVDSDTRVV